MDWRADDTFQGLIKYGRFFPVSELDEKARCSTQSVHLRRNLHSLNSEIVLFAKKNWPHRSSPCQQSPRRLPVQSKDFAVSRSNPKNEVENQTKDYCHP